MRNTKLENKVRSILQKHGNVVACKVDVVATILVIGDCSSVKFLSDQVLVSEVLEDYPVIEVLNTNQEHGLIVLRKSQES